jgi:hypothetical protein
MTDELQTRVALSPQAGAIGVSGGRVTTFDVTGDGRPIAGVTVTDRPGHGNLTVNPDGSLALVLTTSDHPGPLSFGYEIRYADGQTSRHQVSISVAPPSQEEGWGTGNH